MSESWYPKAHPRQALKVIIWRMQNLRKRIAGDSTTPFLGVIDVGQDSYWWDFGTLRAYYDNCLKLTKKDAEGIAIRTFFSSDNRKLAKDEL